MTDLPKEQIEALLEGTTEGPWRWEVSLASKIVKICGGNPHKGFGKYDLTVMEFVRWGMSRAAPMFWGPGRGGQDAPKRADEIAIPVAGREHHERWFRDIDHPDARIMVAAPDLARTALSLYQRVEDAEAAQALAVERIVKLAEATAEEDRAEERQTDGYFTSTQGLLMFAETVRALASDTGKAALAALRAERDDAHGLVKRLGRRIHAQRARLRQMEGFKCRCCDLMAVRLQRLKRSNQYRAERDTLAASLAAAQAEVTALRARAEKAEAQHNAFWQANLRLSAERDALAAHDSRNDKEGG